MPPRQAHNTTTTVQLRWSWSQIRRNSVLRYRKRSKANHQLGQYTLFARRTRTRSSLPNTPESWRTRFAFNSGVGGATGGSAISPSRSRTMLARNSKSRIGLGVMRRRTAPTALMLSSSDVIHSVEGPLAGLFSFARRSGGVRIDDRGAGSLSSEAGARCGTRGIAAGKVWGTRGDDGTLRESP
jgi:hypothetical protein